MPARRALRTATAFRAPGDSQPSRSAPSDLRKIPATRTSLAAATLMEVSLTVNLPDDLAERLAAEAAGARIKAPNGWLSKRSRRPCPSGG